MKMHDHLLNLVYKVITFLIVMSAREGIVVGARKTASIELSMNLLYLPSTMTDDEFRNLTFATEALIESDLSFYSIPIVDITVMALTQTQDERKVFGAVSALNVVLANMQITVEYQGRNDFDDNRTMFLIEDQIRTRLTEDWTELRAMLQQLDPHFFFHLNYIELNPRTPNGDSQETPRSRSAEDGIGYDATMFYVVVGVCVLLVLLTLFLAYQLTRAIPKISENGTKHVTVMYKVGSEGTAARSENLQRAGRVDLENRHPGVPQAAADNSAVSSPPRDPHRQRIILCDKGSSTESSSLSSHRPLSTKEDSSEEQQGTKESVSHSSQNENVEQVAGVNVNRTHRSSSPKVAPSKAVRSPHPERIILRDKGCVTESAGNTVRNEKLQQAARVAFDQKHPAVSPKSTSTRVVAVSSRKGSPRPQPVDSSERGSSAKSASVNSAAAQPSIQKLKEHKNDSEDTLQQSLKSVATRISTAEDNQGAGQVVARPCSDDHRATPQSAANRRVVPNKKVPPTKSPNQGKTSPPTVRKVGQRPAPHVLNGEIANYPRREKVQVRTGSPIRQDQMKSIDPTILATRISPQRQHRVESTEKNFPSPTTTPTTMTSMKKKVKRLIESPRNEKPSKPTTTSPSSPRRRGQSMRTIRSNILNDDEGPTINVTRSRSYNHDGWGVSTMTGMTSMFSTPTVEYLMGTHSDLVDEEFVPSRPFVRRKSRRIADIYGGRIILGRARSLDHDVDDFGSIADSYPGNPAEDGSIA